MPSATREGALVSDIDWAALGKKRVFFGHKSVGRNILSGIRDVLESHPDKQLRLVNTDDPSSVEGPAIMAAEIGENRLPHTKDLAFASVLARGFGEEPGAVAMYKYCYVDVGPHTDAEALFESYWAHASSVRERYPLLVLLHITIPLHTAPPGWRERLRTALGRRTETGLNEARQRYNELLRESCRSTGDLFDLALIESSGFDGAPAFSYHRGAKVPMLAPGWTDDGGHLNAPGRYLVAERFLAFLAHT